MKNGTSFLKTRFKNQSRFSNGINIRKINKGNRIEDIILNIINKSVGENIIKDTVITQIIKMYHKKTKNSHRSNSIIKDIIKDVLIKEKSSYERQLRYITDKIREKYLKIFSIPKNDSEIKDVENLISIIANKRVNTEYNSIILNNGTNIKENIDNALKILK